MIRFGVIELGEFGLYEVALPNEHVKLTWREAKVAARNLGQGFRLPLDYELEELFKSSLLRGILKNASYWSGTETAHTRARSQIYRNGGDLRSEWFVNPGDVESKDLNNYYLAIRKNNRSRVVNPFFTRILELALYDSIRKEYHLNNYVKNGLDRSKVFSAYKQSNTSKKSFLLMMKWGAARTINFERVSACKPKEIQNRLSKFNKLIHELDAESIVDEYLANEDYRISGVNLSFITKHLYFLKPEKFLIYDRFMQNLHVAILLDSDSDLISHYFSFSKKEKVFKIRGGMHGKAYADFIERFKILFTWVNEELARRTVKSFNSLGELESFLFGSANVRNLSNPRVMIVNYIFENKNL
jgi:hypothetical protein